MMSDRVSADLPQSDVEAVMTAISAIRQKLPFLVDLTPEERRSLPKLGDKSQAFVGKTLEVATQTPDFLPRSFDLDEMRQDVTLFEVLYPLLLSLTQLQELVEDTLMVVGSEAYAAALVVYTNAKANGKGAGLDSALDAMGQRFARKTRTVLPPSTSA